MTAPFNLAPELVPEGTRAQIHIAWSLGQNTFEIGQALGLEETVVAEVLRVSREQRIKAGSGKGVR